MATEKQKLAVKKIVENHGNISKSMREAGYTDATAKNPINLTSSNGFKELCDKVGLTDDFILQALTDDISAKPANRVQELSLASKIKGMQIDRVDHTSAGKPIVQLVNSIAEKYGIADSSGVK